MKTKNKNFIYEITQDEFFKLSKEERMISFFKTSRVILKKSNFPEDDEKFKKNFVIERRQS